MASEKITDENIISFLNDELDMNKSNEILQAIKKDEKLREKIKSIQDLDNTMSIAVDRAYPIPDEFLNTIDKIVSEDQQQAQISFKKKIANWLETFSLVGLISGSAFSGAAVASVFLLAFVSIKKPVLENEFVKTADNFSENYRGDIHRESFNTPINWLIQNDISFALSFTNNDKFIDVNNKVVFKLKDQIFFSILPLKTKKINVIYYSNDNNKIMIYSDLILKKGELFNSKNLTIAEPSGMDKILITENNKVILEKNIEISE